MAYRFCVSILVTSVLVAVSACSTSDTAPTSWRPTDPRVQDQWDAPARCGAPAYAWLDDPSLGTVVDSRLVHRVDASNVATVLAGLGLHLGRPTPHSAVVYRMRYWTQDRGQLVEATSLVSMPTVSGPFPLIAFLHGTSGFSDACAPSRGLLDPTLLAVIAAAGFVVVSPDYLGMVGAGAPSMLLHPYVVAEPTAIASLDAVRAARALLPELDVTAEPGLLVLGGSQGGHAALVTARFGPYYAPDEEILAVVASVPLADVLAELTRVTLAPVAGTANAAAVLMAHADWYGIDPANIFVPPYDMSVRVQMDTDCNVSTVLGSATTIDEVFTAQVLAAARADFVDGSDPTACALRESSPPHMSLAALSDPPTPVRPCRVGRTARPRDRARRLRCPVRWRLELAVPGVCGSAAHGGSFLVHGRAARIRGRTSSKRSLACCRSLHSVGTDALLRHALDS